MHINIVDNSNEVDTLQRAARRLSRNDFEIEVIRPASNLGYGRGHNMAIENLLSEHRDVIWVLNPDVTVTNWSDVELSQVASSKSIYATRTFESGRIYSGMKSLTRWTGRSRELEHSQSNDGQMDYPSGHSIMMPSQLWRQIGGFNEDHFLFYEEIDLMMRARKIGINCMSTTSITVTHAKGLTTGATGTMTAKSNLAYRWASESGLRFFLTNMPLSALTFASSRVALAVYLFMRRRGGASLSILNGLARGMTNHILKRKSVPR